VSRDACAVALILACAGGAPARAQDVLRVGTAAAARGAFASGWVDVAAAADPGTRLPVTVVHGARPGPVLALVAGTHGYEYTSVLALPRVRARLDPARMSGSVILVHMANPPSFYGRRVYLGPDGRNLNRVFPGRKDGTISERIAEAITREVIAPATHLVDMHCGDGNESLRPYAYATVTGDEAMDRQIHEMALAFGLDHIVAERSRPVDPGASLYLESTAVLRGKPALTTESGGLGQTDEESVAAHEAGALSLIAHLGIQDLPSVRVAKPVWIDRTEIVRAKTTGVWFPAVEKTQVVAAGALLGRVKDPFGEPLEEVRAPFAGEVLYVVATPPVTAGEPLAFVGQARAAN
jgi:predicted deacylase